MEPGTEFGETPEENLLSVAAVVLRDLETAGFGGAEIQRIAETLLKFAKVSAGGEN